MLIDQVERTDPGLEQRVGSWKGTDNRYMSLTSEAPCFLVTHGLPTIKSDFPHRGKERATGGQEGEDGCRMLSPSPCILGEYAFKGLSNHCLHEQVHCEAKTEIWAWQLNQDCFHPELSIHCFSTVMHPHPKEG